jgi:tetratricopeptide (TPR) repeat protein
MTLMSQAGIYSENDVKVQTEFIESLLAKYSQNNEKAIEHLDAVIATLPDNGAAYFERAKAYKELEDFEKAYSDIIKAIKFDGKLLPYIQLKYDLETILEKWGDLIVTTRSIINVEPDNIYNYYDLVNIYKALGDDNSALGALEETQYRFGINERIANSKIKIYQSKNDINKIKETLNAQSIAYPNDMIPRYRLLDIYIEINDTVAADIIVNDILDIDPDDERARLYQAHKNSKSSGLAGLDLIIKDEAIDVDQKIMQLIPYMERMTSDASDDQNKSLKTYLDVLVQMYPNDPKVFAISGDYYFHTGQLKKALDHYERTLEINDTVFDVWANMIVTMYYLGDIKSMYFKSEEAVDFFPNKAEAYYLYCLASTYLSKFKLAQDYVEEGMLISSGNEYWKQKLESIAIHQLFVEGSYKDAIVQSEKYPKLLMTDAIHSKLFGDLLLKTGDSVNAKRYYKQAYELGFKSPELKQSIYASGS